MNRLRSVLHLMMIASLAIGPEYTHEFIGGLALLHRFSGRELCTQRNQSHGDMWATVRKVARSHKTRFEYERDIQSPLPADVRAWYLIGRPTACLSGRKAGDGGATLQELASYAFV